MSQKVLILKGTFVQVAMNLNGQHDIYNKNYALVYFKKVAFALSNDRKCAKVKAFDFRKFLKSREIKKWMPMCLDKTIVILRISNRAKHARWYAVCETMQISR